MKSYTIQESLHSVFAQLLPAQTVLPPPRCIHVSGSCHGFPNAEVKGRLLAPAGGLPFDRLTSETRSWVDTGLFSQIFFTVSASSRFYCPLPEFFFFSFLFFFPDNARYPLFLPGDNTLPKLTVVQSTARCSHRVRPRPLAPSPPCSHSLASHT